MYTLTASDLKLQSFSFTRQNGVEYGLAQTAAGPRLAILAPLDWPGLRTFEGASSRRVDQIQLLCPLNSKNAAALRNQLVWLQPSLLGLRTSAGLGDRVGLATPCIIPASRFRTGSGSSSFSLPVYL